MSHAEIVRFFLVVIGLVGFQAFSHDPWYVEISRVILLSAAYWSATQVLKYLED
jgi:hypothetical protein